MSKRISLFSRLMPLLLCCSLSLAAQAAQIRTVRFLTKPEHIFVNQSFELFVEVELSVGCEIQNVQFIDFTLNDDLFILGSFEPLPKIQRKVNNGKTTVDVLRFKAIGQAKGTGELPVRARLKCQLVERSGGGFFSSFVSRSVQCAVEPFVFRIQALPEADKPRDFSGAVGTFRVSAQLSSTTAQPGDILTLTTTVQGEGDLRPAVVPVPRQAEGFKIYPMKEVKREMSLLRTEQIFIPQSTNAVEIGEIAFSYFNPKTRTFETAKTGPLRIRFTDKPVQPVTTAVRVIDTTEPVSREGAVAGQGVLLEQMNKGLHEMLYLIIPAGALLIACFIFFQLLGTHTRIGLLLAVAVIGLGILLGYYTRKRSVQGIFEVHEQTTVRFAPSRNAKTLFVLKPGTKVVPLETAGAWKRVDVDGRRGWIEYVPLHVE